MPGKRDRQLTALRQARDHKANALRTHRKTCHACDVAHRTGNPMAYCDSGWELAKQATRAVNMLELELERDAATSDGRQLEALPWPT